MCVLVSSSRATTITSHSCDRSAQLLQGISGTLTCSLSLPFFLERRSRPLAPVTSLNWRFHWNTAPATKKLRRQESRCPLPSFSSLPVCVIGWLLLGVVKRERDREQVRELAEYSIAGGVSLQCKFALHPLPWTCLSHELFVRKWAFCYSAVV